MDAVSVLIVVIGVMIVTIICLGFALIDAIGKVSAQVSVIQDQAFGLDGDVNALYEIIADMNNPPYVRKPRESKIRGR